jgi:arylsulfatase A
MLPGMCKNRGSNKMASWRSIGVLIFVLLGAHWSCTNTSDPPPNFVIIYIDDMGWKDVGCMGSDYYQTPNIDQLAAAGMLFEQAYAAAPVCTPSRGALYTGKAPARTKLTTVFKDDHLAPDERLYEMSKPQGGNIQNLEALQRHVMPREEITFAEALSEAGYVTGFAGKWHVGWHEDFWPNRQGFQYAEGFRTIPEGTRGHFGKHYIDKVQGMPDLKADDDMADKLSELAVKFFEVNRDKPFCFVLSHYAVHNPQEAQESVIEKYRLLPTTDQNNATYAAMVESVDRSVDTVMAALHRLGLEENTVVIFTSDNGGLSERSTSNYPLSGGKSFSYEAGTRVPFIVQWPGNITAGSRAVERTVGMDIYPTLLELSGNALRPEQHRDGVSLAPVLLQHGRIQARPLYFHFPHYTHATGPFSSVIADDWKLIRFYNNTSGQYQLFSLADDPCELQDLADSRPDKVNALAGMLDEWLEETGAELPRVNPDYRASIPPVKDKAFSYKLAMKERKAAELRLK